MTTTDTIKFIVAMIIMMNPLGSLSIFLDLTKKQSALSQQQLALQIGLIIIVLMMLTIWTGKEILTLFGITIPSFRFAGGIILLLTGLDMLHSKESPFSHTKGDDEAAKSAHSIAIVPMGLPVIIGPGAISTLIITVGDYSEVGYKLWITLFCIFLALGMMIMLYFARPIAKFVGASVMKVVTRIMGMIIMAIAVGMLAKGLIGLIPVLQ